MSLRKLIVLVMVATSLVTSHSLCLANELNKKCYTTESPYFRAGLKDQCTWLAWGRACEKMGVKLRFNNRDYPSAKNWWYYGPVRELHLVTGNQVQADSIAVWQGDSTNPDGHVAYVERVEGNIVFFREANTTTGSPRALKELPLDKFQNRGEGIRQILGYIYLNPPSIRSSALSPSTTAGSTPAISQQRAPSRTVTPPKVEATQATVAPAITSVSPNPVTGSNNQQPFTVYGNTFMKGANVILRDLTAGQIFQNRPASLISSTQIVLNPVFTTDAHRWSVEVINPDGKSSGQHPFNIVAPESSAVTASLPTSSMSSAIDTSKMYYVAPENPYRKGECVWFAWGRAYEKTGTKLLFNTVNSKCGCEDKCKDCQCKANPSARCWWDCRPVKDLNLTTSDRIRTDSIAVWGGDNRNCYGHVAYVETVEGDIVSFREWNTKTANDGALQHRTIYDFENRGEGIGKILGYIYLPYIPLKSPGTVLTPSTNAGSTPPFTQPTGTTWGSRTAEGAGHPSSSGTEGSSNPVAPPSYAPTISSVSPNPVTGSNSQQPFTIYGNNFVNGANVILRVLSTGQVFERRSASLFSNNKIVLNPNFTTSPDNWSVEVINPDGKSSGQYTFNVVAPVSTLPPSISTVSPNPVTGSNSPQPFTIYGGNFASGANIVLRDVSAGQVFERRPASSFTSNQIVLNPNFTASAARWSVEVINPDGKSSGQYSFNVVAPVSTLPPSISTISPNPVTGSNSPQPFTIYGGNFASGANIILREVSAGQVFERRPASSFSSNQIVLNPNFTASAARWSIEVINPDGKSSGQYYFNVVAPALPPPAIDGVSPNPVTGSNYSQPFLIYGSNFVTGANVILRDVTAGQIFERRTASSFSSNQILINPNFTASIARWSVEVINPDGKSSGQYFFNVR